MLTAINLYDQILFAAREVGSIWPDSVLPHEFEAIETAVSQFDPQRPLGLVVDLAQSLRLFRPAIVPAAHASPLIRPSGTFSP